MAAAEPIRPMRIKGLGFPEVEHIPEDGSETFLSGVPVFLDADGMANEVTDAFSASEIIYGISAERAHNLTTQNTAETGNEFGAPQNQTNARTTAIGSPVKTGLLAVYRPSQDTIFRIALVDTQTYTVALKSGTTRYELSRTSNGYWAVDSTDTGTGADHAVHIIDQDPNNDEFVYCRFATALIQA